jgi:hypothetical protein
MNRRTETNKKRKGNKKNPNNTQENTTQKTKDLEMGISRKSDSKVL